ncbi:MAG: hypothetical protein KBC56_08695 [Flavobacterium sp.]|nr:hypothetical protein [Flavobacterium sp.]
MALMTSPGVILTPTPTKVMTPTNYLSGDDFDYTNQYLPETDKIIYQRFGNQMITGMLESLGKESPFASDNFKWTEEGRLTQLGTGIARTGDVFTLNNHTFRIGETVYARSLDGTYERKGRISAVTTNDFTAICGNAAGWTLLGTTDIVLYAFGSEYQKGTAGMSAPLNSQVAYFENTPVITKEMISENGSNLAQICWLETPKGYVWYFKNYEDTEKRFKNKIESELILGENWAGALAAAGYQGTQGLFSAMREGNIFSGQFTDLDDADEIIERLNAQGMISQNYLYNTISQGAAISDFLKAESVTAMSWGAFDNSESMALKLDFKGFHRSNYEFYTSGCRFLDDPTTQGSNVGASKVHGLLIPSASKQVYDKTNSTSATLPVLHVKYRANSVTNRKYQMDVRQYGNGTSNGVDSTTTDFQTERMLVLVGRNQTMLFQG